MKPLLVGTILLSVVGGISYRTYVESNRYSSYDKMQAEATTIYNALSIRAGAPVPELVVLDSDILNAWYDGSSITITTALIQKLNNADAIAMIIGHEMGHAILHHDGNTVYGQVDAENAADEIGAFLMLRSGYNICAGRVAFQTLSRLGNGDMADTVLTDHPSHIFRYNTLSMPWCSIERF